MKTRRSMKQRNIRSCKEPIMLKTFSPLTSAGALLSLAFLGAAPARASSLVTFVSGKGSDTGTCASPANPCRTFQFALGQTSANGEIQALDPANYSGVTITKSISISGVEGAGIGRGTAGDAITINAGPNDAINLSHLTVDGLGIAQNGIVLNSGGSLTITDCVVRNFKQDGIRLQTSTTAQFLIGDTLLSDNASFGIHVDPLGTASAQGTLDHVSMNKNGFGGIFVDKFGTSGTLDVTAVDSIATNNNGVGFQAQGNFSPVHGVFRLAHSAATKNAIGVQINVGGVVESFGDNDIRGNGTDVTGTLTHVATQ
jgi:Right handed beta helix region